jgi:cytochrome P450
MMGIPFERAADFKRWSDSLTATVADATPEQRARDIGEMAAYFQSLIGERRGRPGADLVSAVVNAEVDGAHLSDQEIVGFSMLLLIAGNETTTNLLGNLLNILVDRPTDYARLVRDPAVIAAAVDEGLRFDSPVQFLRRTLTRPATFHGQAMAAGDVVNVLTGSANRDERVYVNAGTFDLDRPKINHHSFGFGIHFCIGAPLARLEAQCAMRHLVARFSHIERGTGRNERIGSFLLRGFHHLYLTLQR